MAGFDEAGDEEGGSTAGLAFLDENAGIRSAVAGVRANQRLAATVLRGAGVFADTTVGTRLAAAGRFLEQFGNDVLRAAERHARAETEHTTR